MMKRTCILGLTAFLWLCPMTTARLLEPEEEPSTYTPFQICMGALLNSGFNLNDLENYDQWFGPESVMELAQAGVYHGVDGIREYVGFVVGGVSPYMTDNPATGFQAKLLPIVLNPPFECAITFTGVGSYLLDSELTPGNYYATSVGYRINYSITSPTSILVNRADIYYPVPFLESWFGLNFNEDTFYHYFCSTMKNECPDVWEYNGLNSMQQCIKEFSCLPFADGDNARADGNTQACRVLHASFVKKNPEGHCAHLSFRPLEDQLGRIKCQTSAGRTEEDLFSAKELALFKATAENSFFLDQDMFNVTINGEASGTRPYCRGHGEKSDKGNNN